MPRNDGDLISTPHRIPKEEQTQGGQDRNCIGLELRKRDNTHDSSDASHARRKLAKTSTDSRLVRKDDEFKFESKYYNKQAKKLAQEQVSVPAQRSSRGGRERTHRCYLCFKLFPTAEALETHKENYHLAKSERPVRVKTYAGLEESEEPGNSIAEEPCPPCEALEEVMVKEEPAELSEDFDNITIIIDESVKPHVLKPLCIACRAHTSDDFRKHSKWFSQVPDDFQSDLLKKFQQFLPCTFDPASLVEPWVLCKKCAVLIDKIADMEEKLNSMKSDLLSRVRGSGEPSSDALQNNSSESITGEGSHAESPTSLTEGSVEGLGKSLSDIEAYMKDTCEIMEITKPHKRPGRPRKRVEEKLTPVLVEGREEGESVDGIAGVIAQSLVYNEQENRQTTLGAASNSDMTNEEEKSPTKAGVQSNITFNNVEFKEEPMQYDLDGDGSNSGSWDVILGNQDSQFDSATIEPEKRAQLDPQTFTPDTILNSLEGAAQTDSQTEILEAKKTTDFLGSQKSKPQSYCETFSLESIPISISTKSQDVDAVDDDDGRDTPETLASRESHEGDSALQRGLADHAREAQETTASTVEEPERRPASPLLLEDNKTDLHPLTVTKQASFSSV